MKYDHIVKHNGRYYAAGEEVPEGGDTPLSAPVSVPENQDNSSVEKRYSKTDINKMTTSELQALAAAEGIEKASAKTGGELKKELIEHFEL